MRIYLSALGCKLNQSEIDALARRFLQAGHQVVASAKEADICILNTCTVTHIAARKSRQALRRLRRENPRALIVATGCYAEISPEEIRELGGVDLIYDNRDKDNIPALLAARVPGLEAVPRSDASPRPVPSPRTRAFVKIQDGCNNACTYCIVARARGPEVSRPLPQIIDEIRQRVAEGYREVVLTGVHIGAYGREFGLTLAQLVETILAEINVARLRLSSIEPWDFAPELLALLQNPRLCRHLHLPLQSGCDATLERMGRKYTTAQFAALLAQARAAVPELAVTTDVIVGFPGETEAEFQASLDFVRRARFARIHVFPYSPRPGTPAAEMPGQIPAEIKEARSQIMRRVGEETSRAFRASFLGQALPVLWEAKTTETPGRPPIWSGLTDNYIRVFTESTSELENTITMAKLTALRADGMWAQVLS